jgi:large subunit ribosomal protein L9
VAAGLASAFKVNVDKKKIELPEPIRNIGSYDVTIKLGKDIAAKIKVTVIPEEAV